MTDEPANPTTPPSDRQAADGAAHPSEAPAGRSSAADGRGHRPDYKGAELDPERGPGLGCFWFQVIVLAVFVVLIPIGINLAWPYEVLALLLFLVIGLLLLTGQTVIFLLRLVAADRRVQGRRRPLASPTKTVGELADERKVVDATGTMPSRRAAGRPDAVPAEEPPDVPARPSDAAAPARQPDAAAPLPDALPAEGSPGVSARATGEGDGPAATELPGEPDPGVRQ